MNLRRLIGYAALTAINILVVLYFVIIAVLTDCPSNIECMSEQDRRGFFYGAIGGGVVVQGLLTIWLIRKRKI